MTRPDFRAQAAARLATEREAYTPALIDLLRPEDPARVTDIRRMPIDRIRPNPEQPRQHFDEDALRDLAASIREHGVLQPVLVRALDDHDYQIVAGERRWRASKLAGLTEIPVIVEQIGEEAALEIAIIENLQREDISPLEEAEMFERMTKEHGYSLRKLATKLGKDKGYVENRLRIARAPDEIKELVAVRSDTLSHAYELMKLDDPRKRRRLAKQVATGELSLVKLKQRIEGKPAPQPEVEPEPVTAPGAVAELELVADAQAEAASEIAPVPETELVAVPVVPDGPAVDAVDIDEASVHLDAAVKELIDALQTDPALAAASNNERQQFAKYLTVARIKLDNAIAVVRAGEAREPVAANYAESSE